MKDSLFKNFKSLKEKEEEINVQEKLDNVSVSVKTKDLVSDKKPNIEKDETLNTVEKKSPTLSKRPVKPEILEARKSLLDKAKTDNIYSKKHDEISSKRTFTIFLKEQSFEFLKDLVFFKATAEKQIFFNQSEAIVEALGNLKSKFKNIVQRPEEIKNQEKNRRGGRKRNSDDVYDATTTVYIPGETFDFIKDVTYNKVIDGDMYFKDWDLLEMGIESLRKIYGDKIQPRPDYIREEEKQRGRKS